MEKFLPVLSTIQKRLREILSRNEDYMSSWDLMKIDDTGEELIRLARDMYPQLVEVEHRILFQSLREAGLGIKFRVVEVRKGKLKKEDEVYFRSVHEALGEICEKIETGEYYRALLDIAARREKERSSSK
ncbi:hypothetical protein CW706_00890 [Candidatus Bathyarchaeota archaeon]|nr:MAG: hypothetical protein CW706_00890 [Candidatus Bathyarchaeota archaeon]